MLKKSINQHLCRGARPRAGLSLRGGGEGTKRCGGAGQPGSQTPIVSCYDGMRWRCSGCHRNPLWNKINAFRPWSAQPVTGEGPGLAPLCEVPARGCSAAAAKTITISQKPNLLPPGINQDKGNRNLIKTRLIPPRSVRSDPGPGWSRRLPSTSPGWPCRPASLQ